MKIDQYSEILTIMCILLFLSTIISLALYLFSKKFEKKAKNIDYFLYLKAIGILAITATISVLVYQFYYETPVCEYCWWQRIFMFPIDIIILISIFLNIKKNEIIVGVLAFFGLFFASLHYYFHFQNVVLGNSVSSGCSVVGIVPDCSENSVVVYEFFTIPLMAFCVFLAIIWLSYLAYRSEKNE